MDERYQLVEIEKEIYRLDKESGEVCRLATRTWQGRNASEQFSEDFFKRITEPPPLEAEEEEEESEDDDKT